jgi:ABC-type enterochelin transport system permease subunit
MIANAAFVATLIFLALGFWLMHTLHLLVPWRGLILHTYLKSIALYCVLLFANILGLTVWIERKFFLRDTGRKLRHLDQEIHTGQSELSKEILSRFGAEEEEQ